jgi:putative tricarboxylic transport membrane protein
MEKADIRSGVLIILVGVSFLLSSLRMPWSIYGYEWYACPGFVPSILAGVLMLLGINLFVRGISKKRLNEVDADISSDDKESSVQAPPKTTHLTENPTYRIMLAIGLCAAYIFLLLGRLPYWLSTTIFVAAFIFLFKGANLIKSVAIGALTSIVVILIFYKIFVVFLP